MPYTRLSRWQWTRGHSKGFKNGPLETAGVAVSAVVSLVVAHWMGAKPDVTEIVATVIGSGIVGALLAPLAELAWRFAWAGRDQDQAELAVVREENAQLSRQIEELTSEAPPLVVDYELVAAPTSIPPGARMIRLLHLEPENPDPQVTIMAGEGFSMAHGAGRPFWCRCTVRNRTGRGLLGGLLIFDIAFFRGGRLGEDTIVARQLGQVRLPFLAPEDAFEFYITNRSEMNVSVLLPAIAQVQLEGEGHQRNARLHNSQESMIADWPNILLPGLRRVAPTESGE